MPPPRRLAVGRWLVAGALGAMMMATAAPARADVSVANVGPAFPPGPYSALTVDPKDPRRLALATLAGRVAWSDDAGRSAVESQALSDRKYGPSALRGSGSMSVLSNPRYTARAFRLFSAAMSKGLPWARWAYWMGFSDPYTDVSDIALPVNGRMLLAASSGIFLSDEQRTGWLRTLGGPGSMPRPKDLVALSVAVSPIDPQVVLAGTTQGLHVSRNGGQTFSPHPDSSLGEEMFTRILWDPTRPEMVLAISGGAILQSDDGGGTFAVAFEGAEARDAVLTEGGAVVSTSDGIRVMDAAGERTLLAGESVVGAVPWDDGSILAATETELLVVDATGRRTNLLRTADTDPFLRLTGRMPLAYALTTHGVYRVGSGEGRRRNPKPPRLHLPLHDVERAALLQAGFPDPDDTRFRGRWKANLLPRIVVNVEGYLRRNDGITFDATFPIRYRTANGSSDGNTEWMVVAFWDFSSFVFGDNTVSNPNLLLERQVRDAREQVLKEVRWHYREAAGLVAELQRLPSDPLVSATARLRLQEFASYLEAMSGRDVVRGEDL